jgi:hypothetical protein
MLREASRGSLAAMLKRPPDDKRGARSGSRLQAGRPGNGKADGPQAGGSVNVNRETSAADERQGEDLFLGARVDNSHCFRLDKDGQNLAGSF